MVIPPKKFIKDLKDIGFKLNDVFNCYNILLEDLDLVQSNLNLNKKYYFTVVRKEFVILRIVLANTDLENHKSKEIYAECFSTIKVISH